MTPQQIDNCIQFLQRANLTGGEVPAYVEVVQGLQALRAGTVAALQRAAEPPKDEAE